MRSTPFAALHGPAPVVPLDLDARVVPMDLDARVDPVLRGQAGAVTAEYAIATIAAVGFAALLVVLLRSDVVRGLLTDLIRHALAIPA